MTIATLNTLRAHTTVYLGEVAYYVRNRVEACHMHNSLAQYSLPSQFTYTDGLKPAVVINIQEKSLSENLLSHVFADFQAADDVFSEEFANNSLLFFQRQYPSKPSTTISLDMQDYLRKNANEMYFSDSTAAQIPEGPYLL